MDENLLKIHVKVSPEEVQSFFNNDPRLCYIGLSDAEIAEMYHTGSYQISPHSNYIAMKYNDDIISVMKFEWFTPIAINCHMYLHSQLQNQDYSLHVTSEFKKYLTEFCRASKALITCPSDCIHIQKYALKQGFVKEGHIKDATIWRTKLNDVLIYSLDISNTSSGDK